MTAPDLICPRCGDLVDLVVPVTIDGATVEVCESCEDEVDTDG